MFTEAFQKQMNALSQHIRIQVAAHDLRPGWAREREDPAENPDTQHTHMHLHTHVRAHTHACTHRVHTHKLVDNHVCRTCLHARFTHTHTTRALNKITLPPKRMSKGWPQLGHKLLGQTLFF